MHDTRAHCGPAAATTPSSRTRSTRKASPGSVHRAQGTLASWHQERRRRAPAHRTFKSRIRAAGRQLIRPRIIPSEDEAIVIVVHGEVSLSFSRLFG